MNKKKLNITIITSKPYIQIPYLTIIFYLPSVLPFFEHLFSVDLSSWF